MKGCLKKILEEERLKKGRPLELKRIGGNYYLYESTTVWLKGEGKRKKVSRYIGNVPFRFGRG